jgi:hypothetical protein
MPVKPNGKVVKCCANCKFWDIRYMPPRSDSEGGYLKPDESDDWCTEDAACKRHAPRPWVAGPRPSHPQIHQSVDTFEYAYWPITEGAEWCGEFQPLSPAEIRVHYDVEYD